MKFFFLFPLWLYRFFVSPFLGTNCRFTPGCAEYAKDALARHGAVKGSWLALRRVMRCHPFSEPAFDPIPEFRVQNAEFGKKNFLDSELRTLNSSSHSHPH